jgi:ferritin-like metal-binding protein YciE
MKFLVEHLKNLRELYLNQLQMLLSAEEQIAIAAQTMVERSTDRELAKALQMHFEETENQVRRLRKILTAASGSAELIKCKAAHALIAETEDMLLDARNEAVRDVALIAAAQRIEHYEIAVYGTVRRFAEILDETAALDLLGKTIEEEKNADRVLTAIADRLNPYAKETALRG